VSALVIMVALVVGASTACTHGGAPPGALALAPTAPPDVQRGCDLVAVRCTRCHPLERVTSARVATPAAWRGYVARVRLTPAGGIPAAEEEPMARCLIFRSFGAAGLAAPPDVDASVRFMAPGDAS